MKLFGLQITRAKAHPLAVPGDRSGGWHNVVHEPFPGAWQRNLDLRAETVLSYHAVYSCITLIASDIAKCCVDLAQVDKDDIWIKVTSPAFSPVLRKPNRYQNRIKFYEQWVVSKLVHGNTYVLLERDNRQVVVAMYILDPTRCRPMVTPDGAVYYEVSRDNLAGLDNDKLMVPASEIIHDTLTPLYHPLCGVSALTSCNLAAAQGLNIQQNSASFFRNGAQPSGILTAPGNISDADAQRLKAYWEEKFTGNNAGKVAVVGSDLTYAAMTMNAVDAELIDQLKLSAETVCSSFHVPAYKVGVGPTPAYNNIEALDQQYYTQCLQKLFECIELCLEEGLGLVDAGYRAWFDLDELLRMDTATLVDSEVKAVRGSLKAPNEGRKRLNLKPVKGGDSPLAQHQDYSLAALAKRDAKDDPFAAASSPASTAPAKPDDADNDNSPEALAATRALSGWIAREMLAAS